MKKGFTLIELLFVLAIISIIAGIGISNMSGSTDAAENTAIKANIRNAITEAQLYYIDNNQSYVGWVPSFMNNGSKDTKYGIKVFEVDNQGGKDFCVLGFGHDENYYRYNSKEDYKIEQGKDCQDFNGNSVMIGGLW